MTKRWALLAASISALAFFFVGAASASAHDDLLSTTPSNGEILTLRPPAIELLFTAAPLEGTTKLVATADTGAKIHLDQVVVSGARVVARWPKHLPAGLYVIAWRTVGTDGHPLTGTFTFTYTTPGEGPVETSRSGSPDVTILPTTPSATPAPTAASSGSAWLWPTLAGILIIVAAIIVMVVLRRRNSNETPTS